MSAAQFDAFDVLEGGQRRDGVVNDWSIRRAWLRSALLMLAHVMIPMAVHIIYRAAADPTPAAGFLRTAGFVLLLAMQWVQQHDGARVVTLSNSQTVARMAGALFGATVGSMEVGAEALPPAWTLSILHTALAAAILTLHWLETVDAKLSTPAMARLFVVAIWCAAVLVLVSLLFALPNFLPAPTAVAAALLLAQVLVLPRLHTRTEFLQCVLQAVFACTAVLGAAVVERAIP